MMYPWLDYKGLAYYSKKLRDKLKSAFSDIYDDIADITDAEIEELFEEDESETSDENSITQSSIEDNENDLLQGEETNEQNISKSVADNESKSDLEDSPLIEENSLE